MVSNHSQRRWKLPAAQNEATDCTRAMHAAQHAQTRHITRAKLSHAERNNEHNSMLAAYRDSLVHIRTCN